MRRNIKLDFLTPSEGVIVRFLGQAKRGVGAAGKYAQSAGGSSMNPEFTATQFRKSVSLVPKMEKVKLAAYFLILAVLFGWMHFRGSAAREVTRRIRAGVQAAEDKLPRPPAPIWFEDNARFAADLASIDSTGAPEPLRTALSNYVAAAERHRDRVRATGVWDTNTAWQIQEAQGKFRKTVKAGF